MIRNNKKDKYAIIISGTVDERDVKDINLAYRFFLLNGFRRENIYVLDKDGLEKEQYRVDGICSKDNIETLICYLSQKIDKKDLLFFYITDHGFREPLGSEKRSGFYLSAIDLPGKKNINEIELRLLLDEIKSKRKIVFADICYSGGFARRFSNGNYIGISSSESDGKTYFPENSSFARQFFSAYKSERDSDLNGDRRVSIKEAFEYAREKHPPTKEKRCKPLLKSYIDLDNLFITEF